jgi:hypothetical protein
MKSWYGVGVDARGVDRHLLAPPHADAEHGIEDQRHELSRRRARLLKNGRRPAGNPAKNAGNTSIESRSRDRHRGSSRPGRLGHRRHLRHERGGGSSDP